jgi:hypothetical protein
MKMQNVWKNANFINQMSAALKYSGREITSDKQSIKQ